MKASTLFPIRYAADQTGLSQHVIRVWERRYGVVEPERSGTNRRLYTEADIKRLHLLKKAVGLSLTNLSDPHRLKIELVKLRNYLSSDITIYIGGQIAPNLADSCKPDEIVLLRDIDTFRQALETEAD